MTISFYKTTDDPKKLNKSMLSIGSGQGTLTAPVSNTAETISLLSPTFILATNSLYFTATHIFVAEMGNRYYFINDIQLLTGGKMSISCSIDVLKTYASEIITRPCTVTRYSHAAGKIATPTYIPDSRYPLDTSQYEVFAQNYVDTPFISGIATNMSRCYILTTMGGGTE